MSHRRRVKPSPREASGPASAAEIIIRFGSSRLVVRDHQLYNGWDGPCQDCGNDITCIDLASRGLRCPLCHFPLYRPGNARDILSTVKQMEKEASLTGCSELQPSDEDRVLYEVNTGLCSFCGSRMTSHADDIGFLYCGKCFQAAEDLTDRARSSV